MPETHDPAVVLTSEDEMLLRLLRTALDLVVQRQSTPFILHTRPWPRIEISVHADALKDVTARAEIHGIVYTLRELADKLVWGGPSANVHVRVVHSSSDGE
jgi:hypothetical protein